MKLLSIEETCKTIGLGRTKIYQLVNSGELKAHKIGKRTVFRNEDVESFIESLEPYSPNNKGGVYHG